MTSYELDSINRTHTYEHWDKIEISLWRWAHFTPSEFACKHTGRLKINEDFLDRLESLRVSCDFPFIINSGYRDPTHPIEAAKTVPGAHSLGKAADIGLSHGGQKYELVTKARRYGFTGIGIEGVFIHLDTCYTGEFGRVVRPALWSY